MATPLHLNPPRTKNLIYSLLHYILMRKYNPYRNIFYYYRGPSTRKNKGEPDKQIEDNTTKALINTLEIGGKGLLKRFLDEVKINIDNIPSDKIKYDLQVLGDYSRPDALIQVGDNRLYIESKIESPLERDQIKRHLQSFTKGYMVCITPRDKDVRILQEVPKNNLRFITWKNIYLGFQNQYKRIKDQNTKLILGQFLEYLEMINMAPFSVWNKYDFEAFLNIGEDPKKELRLRVREKMKVFLADLKELMDQENLYKDLKPDVGNVQKNSFYVWGVLCKPPIERKVHKPHFNFIIDSDVFTMGIEIEGITPARRMRKYIMADKDRFLKILGKLEGFDLTIRKRVPTGKIRQYQYFDVLKVKLGRDVSKDDISYILKKVEQYNLYEFYCGTSHKRDDKALNDRNFMKKTVRLMKSLEDYYNFSWGE